MPFPPDQLYHYTSFDGLLGLLRSRSIWATSIRHLNDAQEFTHGRQLAHVELEQRLSVQTDQHETKFLERLATRLQQLRDVEVFVASFSEVGDLLSQWRGYCPIGKGVSLGFSGDVLRRRATAHGFRLAPVIYDPLTQQAKVCDLIDRLLADRGTHGVSDDHLVHYFGHEVASIAPLLKHSTFMEEREWRLISESRSVDRSRVKVRMGQARIIPYVEFALVDPDEQLRVRDIKIGPNPLPDLALDGVTIALQTTNTIARSVSLSSVPFRAW